MKIGIIGAMEIEVTKLQAMLEDCTVELISGQKYYSGRLCGSDVVVAKCGEGKVNAAICAQTMILKYAPDMIINTGVAGGVGSTVCVMDLVIAKNVVQHDMDMTFLGHKPGYVAGIDTVYVDCDGDLHNRLVDAAEKLDRVKIHVGTIASGDKFVHKDVDRAYIIHNFNALCVEMEGASIGHVCKMNNTPFCVVRAISDAADSESNISFNDFMEIAADISVRLVTEFVKN